MNNNEINRKKRGFKITFKSYLFVIDKAYFSKIFQIQALVRNIAFLIF
jgi:hypothetical protein